jgi:hypothetical protein
MAKNNGYLNFEIFNKLPINSLFRKNLDCHSHDLMIMMHFFCSTVKRRALTKQLNLVRFAAISPSLSIVHSSAPLWTVDFQMMVSRLPGGFHVNACLARGKCQEFECENKKILTKFENILSNDTSAIYWQTFLITFCRPQMNTGARRSSIPFPSHHNKIKNINLQAIQ